MAYSVQVFRAMIASPGDTSLIRNGIYGRILEFNFRDSEGYGFALQPILWEKHAPAASGKLPQGVLDDELVNKSDILLGIFRRKFGNPVAGHNSGTVHEIEVFANPNVGRNPSVIFMKDMSKIKAPDRQKIRDYQTDIQSRDFLTASYETDIDAIELGFRSILYQAEQLKLFLDSGGDSTVEKADEVEADEVVSDDTIQIEEPAPNLTYAELEELADDTAEIPVYSSRKYPRYNAQNSIASWSNGIRFPASESMQQALKNANRLASSMAFESISDRTSRQIQQISRSVLPLSGIDKNFEAKKAIQAVMGAVEIPSPPGFKFSVSKINDEPMQWVLENTDTTTVLIVNSLIKAQPHHNMQLEDALEGRQMDIRLESGEAELFEIPDEYLNAASSAEIIFEYRRDSGDLEKGKLLVEGG